jgi:trigger factor
VGRAPRKLVEARFRKEVAEQVKSNLLLDSLSQLTDEHKLAAISEPDIDPFAITLPDDGPFKFEFDLEVRPEFELPNWKGLTIARKVCEITDEQADARMKELLAPHGTQIPKAGPAEVGDYLAVDVEFRHGERVVSRLEEEVIRLMPTVTFKDARITGFDKAMAGVVPGDRRELKFKLSSDAPNEELRGEELTAAFEILEVKRLQLPELTPAFLQSLGGFESVEQLRNAVKAGLQRRIDYEQSRETRKQITSALVETAHWDLPPALLRRQAQRELERSVMELRASGFSNAEIRVYENELRQNIQFETARALKEHFILERIAEEEKIEEKPEDYDREIELIAAQLEESPRRLRARLEKRGQMDALRNQIIERKVIKLILQHARFHDQPFQFKPALIEAVDQFVGGGGDAEIPEAKREGAAAAAQADE